MKKSSYIRVYIYFFHFLKDTSAHRFGRKMAATEYCKLLGRTDKIRIYL